jgi:hypothetical protein
MQQELEKLTIPHERITSPLEEASDFQNRSKSPPSLMSFGSSGESGKDWLRGEPTKSVKRKSRANTLPTSRSMRQKPMHRCSDLLSDPRLPRRLTQGLRARVDNNGRSVGAAAISEQQKGDRTLGYLGRRSSGSA